jgi:hypothetical protein
VNGAVARRLFFIGNLRDMTYNAPRCRASFIRAPAAPPAHSGRCWSSSPFSPSDWSPSPITTSFQPIAQARHDGDKPGQHAISATSALLMTVVLLILVAGLLLTFRIGRLFFPRNAPPRTKTQYVDAWAESAKRMETPPPEE